MEQTYSAMMAFFLIVFLVGIFLFIVNCPALIAEKRGVRKLDVKIITALSWCGILFFPLWIIAFILSLVYQPEVKGKRK